MKQQQQQLLLEARSVKMQRRQAACEVVGAATAPRGAAALGNVTDMLLSRYKPAIVADAPDVRSFLF
jgi:hypothetical protein